MVFLKEEEKSSYEASDLYINWEAGIRAPSWHHRGAIVATHLNLCSESTCNVHISKGGGKRCSEEETGGNKVRAADEGGEEGARCSGWPPFRAQAGPGKADVTACEQTDAA